MSFFEIEPMGARHYGGMPMGGINVGGMNVGGMMYGGGRKGVALTEAQKKAMKEGKEAMAEAVDARAEQLYEQFRGQLSIREAIDLARDELTKEKRSGRASAPRPKKGEVGYKPAKKHEKEWYLANPASVSTIKKRINTSKKGSILNGNPITTTDLKELDAWLRLKGYGLGDLEGCGFFDDLYHGVKNVGKTALSLAPSILPYVLG